MCDVLRWLRWAASDASGQDLIEYGLLIMFIALVAMTAVGAFGVDLSDYWNASVATLNSLVG
jgi:Flp pilus assembly pilin Flp